MKRNVTRKKLRLTPGEQIKDALVTHQMSQSDLAKEVGVSPSTISQWCDDKRNPKPRHQKLLCEILHLDIYQFQGYELPQDYEHLTFAEQEHLSLYRHLTDRQRLAISQMIKAFLES